MTTATYELLERCLVLRDDESWERFLARCGKKLRRILSATLAGFVGSRDGLELEDLGQDLCCRLLSGPGSFEGRTEGEVWGYLWRVVRTLVADRRRYLRADKRNVHLGWRDPVELEELTCPHPDPEWLLLRAEARRHLVDRSAACFPAPRRKIVRRVVWLALLEGCSSREVAARLGGELSAKQVDSLLSRVRRRLAERGIELPRRHGGRRWAEGAGEQR